MGGVRGSRGGAGRYLSREALQVRRGAAQRGHAGPGGAQRHGHGAADPCGETASAPGTAPPRPRPPAPARRTATFAGPGHQGPAAAEAEVRLHAAGGLRPAACGLGGPAGPGGAGSGAGSRTCPRWPGGAGGPVGRPTGRLASGASARGQSAGPPAQPPASPKPFLGSPGHRRARRGGFSRLWFSLKCHSERPHKNRLFTRPALAARLQLLMKLVGSPCLTVIAWKISCKYRGSARLRTSAHGIPHVAPL